MVHKFVVLLWSGNRPGKVVKTVNSREAAETASEVQMKDMSDYMSDFYLTIEERLFPK